MRGNRGAQFFAVILLIGILTYTAFVPNAFWGKIPGAYNIRKGIDIRGGVHATLYAVKNDGTKPTEKELESARSTIGKRLDGKQIFDRTLTTDLVNGRVIVEIPYKQGDKDQNPQKAIDEIGKTALLTFQEVDESKKDANGDYIPTGKIVVEGKQVVDASVNTDPNTGGVVVSLELNAEGAKNFAEATARLVGQKIAIYLDDKQITAPKVEEAIPSGKAVINGQRDAKEAAELASLIRSGALPFKLEAREVSSISPTLGEGAFNVTVQAGIVSFLIVCLFMLLLYRLPGLLADIALLGLAVISLLVISWMGITLTLPGIAGIILSIGMGVDANIIIFERVKDELKSGKTLGAAIDLGFKRAFTAILDSNVTTILAGAVLIIFGTGAIRGFGVTLCLGVFLSFFTAITASRIMLQAVANLDIAKNHWLYGA
jgi:preprotein translocase subunit SecD